MGDTLGEIENVLKTVDSIAETAAPELEAAFPGLAAFLPFLNLFKVVIGGVDIAHQQLGPGAGLHQAIAAVQDHNTPGAANLDALGPDAPTGEATG